MLCSYIAFTLSPCEHRRALCNLFFLLSSFFRSSAISLLQRMQKEGGTNVIQILMLCVHQLQSDHQLLAANILLQLDALVSFEMSKIIGS